MYLKQKPATLMLSTAIILAVSSAAFAKPAHHHRHHSAQRAALQSNAVATIHDDRFPFLDQPRAAVATPRGRKARQRAATAGAASANATSAGSASFAALGSDPLITEARRYLGTNPTGRGSLWCGAFMDMVLRRTGHPGGGNLAKAYARYGHRVSGPQVGAIAVMGRPGGGHVGIVTGLDPHGNPIIISGNHNHEVAESVYPRGRIFAYVMP